MRLNMKLRLLVSLILVVFALGASAQSTGDKLFLEGRKLEQKGTVASLNMAIKKYKAAKTAYTTAEKKKKCTDRIAICTRKINEIENPPQDPEPPKNTGPSTSAPETKEKCTNHNNAERVWAEVYAPTIKKYPSKRKVTKSDKYLDIILEKIPLYRLNKNLYISSKPLPESFLDQFGLFKGNNQRINDVHLLSTYLSMIDNLQSEFYLPTKDELVKAGLCTKADVFLGLEPSTENGVISIDGKIWPLVCIPADGESQPRPESLFLIMRANEQSIWSSFSFKYLKDDVYASEVVTEDVYRIVCGRNHNQRLPNDSESPVYFKSIEEANNFVNAFNSFVCSFESQDYTLCLPTKEEVLTRNKMKHIKGESEVLSSNGQLWLICKRNTYLSPWRVPNVEMPYYRVAYRAGLRCIKCGHIFRTNYFSRYANKTDVEKALR